MLDILVQSRRNQQAEIRFLRRLLTGMQYAPHIIVTDRLKSYGAAIKELKLEVDHRQHKGLNNRARTPTNPRANGNTPCDDSSLRSKSNGFWRRSV